jgi:hypothetical protein
MDVWSYSDNERSLFVEFWSVMLLFFPSLRILECDCYCPFHRLFPSCVFMWGQVNIHLGCLQMIDKVVSKNGMINLKLMLASCNCCIFCSISELCLEGRSIAFQFIYCLTVWICLINNNGVLVVDFPMFWSDDINWNLADDSQCSFKSAYKALPKWSSSHGLPSKIGFGSPAVWRKEGGQIVASVRSSK